MSKDTRKRIRCSQCEAAMINGIFCHETGCPNTNSRYDSESGEWIKQRECFECGYTVDADDPCCNANTDGIYDECPEHGEYEGTECPSCAETGEVEGTEETE